MSGWYSPPKGDSFERVRRQKEYLLVLIAGGYSPEQAAEYAGINSSIINVVISLDIYKRGRLNKHENE